MKLAECTVSATSARRIGRLPGCLAIGAADIGVAVVDGREVTITWGMG